MQFIDPKGSFLKNLMLSLLLGLSSLLIPLVLNQIDDRKAVDHQRLEAELSRQDNIIDAQAALIDALAASFWGYELYASDVIYSRDERYGQDDWHQRALDAYYLESGPLLGKMRAEISTLLRLAPQPTYESLLTLYEEEIISFDACLLELMKADTATPGASQTVGCEESDGRFAGATWATLSDYVLDQDLAARVDAEIAALAKGFHLTDTID